MTPLEPVDYVLEATSNEFYFLWKMYHTDVTLWNDTNTRHMITIGTLDHRPICLSYGYCQINNKKILVWGLTSELVDYKMAEKWLKNG